MLLIPVLSKTMDMRSFFSSASSTSPSVESATLSTSCKDGDGWGRLLQSVQSTESQDLISNGWQISLGLSRVTPQMVVVFSAKFAGSTVGNPLKFL